MDSPWALGAGPILLRGVCLDWLSGPVGSEPGKQNFPDNDSPRTKDAGEGVPPSGKLTPSKRPPPPLPLLNIGCASKKS